MQYALVLAAQSGNPSPIKALIGMGAVLGVSLVVIAVLDRDDRRELRANDVEQARCDVRAKARRPEWWRRLQAQWRLGEAKRKQSTQ